jgi:ParB family chromosome partitioning protein
MSAAAKSPAKSATILALPLDAIVESPDNPRKHFDAAFIAELAGSLAKSGQFTPCLVRPHPNGGGKYELAAGATRLRAARVAKLERLDCIVRAMDDAQFLELLTFENLKRRDLRPMEEARGYANLQKRIEGWTVEKLAERSSVSPDYVRDRLRLLKLTPAAVKLLEEGRIPLTHALELAKLDSEAQARVIEYGLFDENFDGQYSALDELDKEINKQVHEKPVALAELKHYIDEHVRVDLEHPELEHLLPDTHKALQLAKLEKRKQVYISLGHTQPEIRDGIKAIAPTSWKRADGLGKSKTCEYSVLGVVAGGDAARGRAFLVCAKKEKCTTHWPEHVKRAKQRAAEKSGASALPANGAAQKPAPGPSAAELRRRANEEAEEKARAAREASMEKARPEILAALANAVKKAKPARLIDAILTLLEAFIWLDGDSKKLAKLVSRGSSTDDAIRRMFWLTLFDESEGAIGGYNSDDELPKVCKQFGVDVKAILAKHEPAEKKAAAPKKKGKAPR